MPVSPASDEKPRSLLQDAVEDQQLMALADLLGPLVAIPVGIVLVVLWIVRFCGWLGRIGSRFDDRRAKQESDRKR